MHGALREIPGSDSWPGSEGGRPAWEHECVPLGWSTVGQAPPSCRESSHTTPAVASTGKFPDAAWAGGLHRDRGGRGTLRYRGSPNVVIPSGAPKVRRRGIAQLCHSERRRGIALIPVEGTPAGT